MFGGHVVVVVPSVAVVIVLTASLATVIVYSKRLGDLRYLIVLRCSLSRPPPRPLHLLGLDWFFDSILWLLYLFSVIDWFQSPSLQGKAQGTTSKAASARWTNGVTDLAYLKGLMTNYMLGFTTWKIIFLIVRLESCKNTEWLPVALRESVSDCICCTGESIHQPLVNPLQCLLVPPALRGRSEGHWPRSVLQTSCAP